MKSLIVLSGLPGSGKSTWAAKFVNSLPEGEVKVVSADLNRLAIGGSYKDFTHESEVWSKVYEDILMYADDDSVSYVIVDNTSVTNKQRMNYSLYASKYDELILVLFRTNKQTCVRRNAEREIDKIVPYQVIDRMAKYWEEPNDTIKKIFKINEVKEEE